MAAPRNPVVEDRRRRAAAAAAVPWLTQLEADRRVLARARKDRKTSAALSAAAPRLADSRYAADLDALLATLPRERVLRDAGLALAAGRRAVAREELSAGIDWLVRAQGAAIGRSPQVVARIAFQLGGAYITRSELAPADAVLAWAEGILGTRSEAAPDLSHLRALIAELRGGRDESMALYRQAIRGAPAALTPLSRVLALRNLAEALAHSDPREAVALYGLALAVINADELEDSARCAIANAMGYALLCSGDLDSGRLKLGQALEEARRVERPRIALYARFNLSIVDELRGDITAARAKLDDVRGGASRVGLDEIASWAAIRIAWLAARSGDADAARTLLRTVFPAAVPVAYREAVSTLRAIADLGGPRAAAARRDLGHVADAYLARGDELTAFALLLWEAHADAKAGRVAAARRGVARACELGSVRGFRVATNWWTGEIVDTARTHVSAEFGEYVETLVAPPPVAGTPQARKVVISADGAITVDGSAFDPLNWRSGRTGAGVLQRYFRALVAAHPAALARDEIADLLWPDSEGDKAVRNLYAATNDLRRVLATLPGVSLAVSDQRYRLDLGRDVRLI